MVYIYDMYIYIYIYIYIYDIYRYVTKGDEGAEGYPAAQPK